MATLSQFVFNIDLGIDELPFKDDMSSVSTDAPGRMSAATALALSLLALSILQDQVWSDKLRRYMLFAVQVLGLSVFLSYPFSLAFGSSLFLFTGMAFNTSILMIFASLALLIDMPDRGWMDLLIARTPLGASTRALLVTVLLVPFLLGWLIYYGEDMGMYSSSLGRSTYTVTVMLLLGAIVVLNAERLHDAGQTQRTLERNLDALSRQMNSLIENSPSAISIKDVRGRYKMVNSQFAYLAQMDRDEIIGKPAEAIFRQPLLQAVIETDRKVFGSGEAASREIAAIVDGVERIYLNVKFPLFDEKDQILGLGGIWTDITEQKQLQDTLRTKNTDLERSNQELEQFAYVASHDLQEPLRMVSSYMQLLESRYKDKLDDDAKEFIDFAVDGAARMQRLIQDLLAFSRVGTRGRAPEVVSAEAALTEALHNLGVRIQENGARIEHEELPTVFVDRNQLTQVFQNLVGNAIKFRAEREPVITVQARPHGEFYEFRVQDNGIGFDPKHADRIFIIFQRLNSRETYEGTGIGLAICKKIIERHGGRIWVESAVGEGTTFYFTLPRQPQAAEAAEATSLEMDSQIDGKQAVESVEERAKRLI
ncbi:MAG: PAS domain-containing protein [Anaerolineales bacterium]|nr:PAS domain-containing protein [Anaerolineales bacterium]